ncbi:MAG: vWA domain-containing protein [Candidatus Sedimenticola endophacoides]
MAIFDIRALFRFGLLFMVALTSGLAQGAVPEVAPPDVRVLIDISGSMKQNDPRNLRRPALRLLVGLLPEDARAGVWTFGQYVNMQVPLGKVDTDWKGQAREGASKIHSLGLFTNIEEAIKRASEDWRGAPEKYHRHMILLTDGMVDISKRSEPSQASRSRIIEQLIPRLQGLGARVHTIALSDKADHGLMRQLATASGGWHEQVDNAELLQRIFLRMFEKVGQPDTLPLKDNRFVVDASIEEVTPLVFRDEGAAPTRIVPAAGDAFDAASAPAGVSWHRDEGYDLLTIAGPVPGEWRIEAAVDPDNRVMVVTQLKMRTSDAPATLSAGEPLPLQVRFTDRDELITDQGFLDVLQVQVQTFDADGPSEPRPVMDNGEGGDEKAGDALFGTALETEMSPGKVELVIRAEGKTFARERRQYFELEAAPEPVVYATLDVAEQVQIGKPGIMVRVLPNDEVLARDAVEVSATLESDQGEGQPVMFLPGIDGNQKVWIDQSLLR